MLALGFLLMIGTTLIADGLGFHVPKGYIYSAMAFSALVEGLNMLVPPAVGAGGRRAGPPVDRHWGAFDHARLRQDHGATMRRSMAASTAPRCASTMRSGGVTARSGSRSMGR